MGQMFSFSEASSRPTAATVKGISLPGFPVREALCANPKACFWEEVAYFCQRLQSAASVKENTENMRPKGQKRVTCGGQVPAQSVGPGPK